ncbi:MAG: protein kinase family protein [Bacteroidetes bacterium]|nr:protein kinase family protein [bacterium]NBP66050.1 protein kinase family protein [Bacteroidota bacterium]
MRDNFKKYKLSRRNGGDFINEGSYGCAFTPPLGLNCRTLKRIPPNTPLISKLFNSESHFKDEMELQKTVLAIDPRNLFTVPYYGSCHIDINKLDIKEKSYLDKCELFSEYRSDKPDSSNIPQLIYRYGGIDLTEAFNKSEVHAVDLIPLFKPLFQGIKLLQEYKSGYAHCDIKPHNIVFDKTAQKLYIIDFGLMGEMSRLKDEYDILSFDYQYYPPEFKVKSNIDFGTNDINLIANYISLNYNKVPLSAIYKYWKQYYPKDKSFHEHLKLFIKNSIDNHSKFSVDFKTVFVKKLDSYSLAMSFLEYLHRSKKVKLSADKKLKLDKFLANIILPAIHPNPYLRIDVNEILRRFI